MIKVSECLVILLRFTAVVILGKLVRAVPARALSRWDSDRRLDAAAALAASPMSAQKALTLLPRKWITLRRLRPSRM